MEQQHDVTSLPKWAQVVFAEQSNQIRLRDTQIAGLIKRLETGPEDSDTFADPYSEPMQPLGNGTMVRFNGSTTIGGTYDVQMRGGDLYVLANDTSDEVAILPQSNNTIRIRRVPRRPRV